MDQWWDNIAREIEQYLTRHGDSTPAQLGQHLGMSDGAIASLICVLAVEGKVRITRVAAAAEEGHRVPEPRQREKQVFRHSLS